MASHIKYRHYNVKSLAQQHGCNTRFYKKTDKNCRIEVMQIILVNNHGNKLVDEYKTDDHSRYGNHHVVGQGFYHIKNAGVPSAGSFADLPCNRAYFVIDIGKHGFKVGQNPPLQQFLYEFSNLINDPAHEL